MVTSLSYPTLKLKTFILLLGMLAIGAIQAHACSQDQNLSWVNKLNFHSQGLSKTSQNEAELIVQNALSSASESEHCLAAQSLVYHGEAGIRQTLKSPLLEDNINDNPKELSGSLATETGVNNNRIDDTSPYPKLLVFVSFSMPAESLKTLHTQVSQLGGKLVLRGLVQGSFQQTAQKLKELQIDMIIDPTLFEAYQINQAPTFILRNSPTERVDEEVIHDSMAGNVSLEHVLEQFSTSGDTRHDALQMLKTLRREP